MEALTEIILVFILGPVLILTTVLFRQKLENMGGFVNTTGRMSGDRHWRGRQLLGIFAIKEVVHSDKMPKYWEARAATTPI